MSVVIVDYGSGNLHSAAKAFERAARDHGNAKIIVSSDPAVVQTADRVVLPGVGAFKDCREGLLAIAGMWETLEELVVRRARPFLGICVGMQLMASRGLEHDVSDGFDWIPGDVVRIEPGHPSFKIPHMGWNTLDMHRSHALLDGVPVGGDGLHAYFVHSYHLVPSSSDHIVATSSHGIDITAMVARDNIAGTQFHPEKSQTLGLALIGNFLRWRP